VNALATQQGAGSIIEFGPSIVLILRDHSFNRGLPHEARSEGVSHVALVWPHRGEIPVLA
jgi:hypothetical protein